MQTLKYVNCKKTDCVGEREAEQKEEDKDAKRERKKDRNWDERQTETICGSVTEQSAGIVRESCTRSQFKTQINCGYITNPGLRRQ